MKKIIINADDFGINEVVTKEIERQILAGRVTSTTVMANGVCLEEVKRFAAEHPEVSFGVHLCLSEFVSLTKSEGLMRAGLTDEKGAFIHKAICKIKDFDNLTLDAIRSELHAQIDIISSLDFPISHADSHHHVHTIYPLREVFADTLKKRGIKKVRLGGDFRTLRMKAHVGLWLKRIALNKFYKKQFITTDGFYSYAELVNDRVTANDGETVELMCHPGHPGVSFCKEMKLVKDNVAIDNDVKLISYNELY